MLKLKISVAALCLLAPPAFAGSVPRTTAVNEISYDALHNHDAVVADYVQLPVFSILGLPDCSANTQGIVVYVIDGNGAADTLSFHGQVKTAMPGQKATLITSAAFCDGIVWRYI